MTGASTAKVGIVVLNWNGAAETVACLDSLAAATLDGAAILVVDNASEDDSVAQIRARFPGQEILALPENEGFAGGNNAAIRQLLERGVSAVLLLNNDTRVAPDFLPPLLETLAREPRCAAVSSAIRRLDRPDMLDVAYSEWRLDQRAIVHIVGVNALPAHGFDSLREVQIATGCSVLLAAPALRDVGLFDDAYFAYHEDVDWCLRARRAGYRIMWDPRSRVFHRGSASTQGLRPRPGRDYPVPWEPQLPNAEPLPWNPVRAYLGSRNLVRLLHAHATAADRRAFWRRSAKELPLEFFAFVLGRLGWMRLGRWNYAQLARFYFIERHRWLREAPAGWRGTLRRAALLPFVVPFDLLVAWPRDLLTAIVVGRLDEFIETLRGLRDGALGRPIPFARLGLRGRASARPREDGHLARHEPRAPA
jgi:GT2 family glycosyltransferase